MSAPLRARSPGAPARGLGGWLAGQSRLHRPSSRARARWAVALLDLQSTDDVLEVGCGPGYALGLIARASRGRIVGLDRSRLMIAMAARRLRRLHSDARTTLLCAEIADLPRFDVAFEKVLSIDTWQQLDDAGRVLDILRERLAPGGRIAIVARPSARTGGAGEVQSLAAEIAHALEAAGFQRIESHFHGGSHGRAGTAVTAHRPAAS